MANSGSDVEAGHARTVRQLSRSELTTGLPLAPGIALLWLLFWPGLLLWWAAMEVLFREGSYVLAVGVAYALPVLYTGAAYLASRFRGQIVRLMHFATFFVLSLVFGLIVLAKRDSLPASDSGPFLGIALIAAVMSIMQYPKAGLKNYQSYRSSLFIGGVIFMPLFIYIAAMLPNVPAAPALDKVYLFPIGMLGFWLSAAWLALRAAQGGHVPGLEIRPMLPFRPDFILPGGVNYVKGVILMGVGLMIGIHPSLGMPKWNWWGFVLAFWGIITIIPLRGIYKMAYSRRLRMLGLGGMGFRHEVIKGLILFVGLLILLYGFVNAFFGTIPFTKLGVTPEFNIFASGAPAARILTVVSFLVALVLLVPVRAWYKTTLFEGIESWQQMLLKQLTLWLGTLSLIVSFVHLFNLPPIRTLGISGLFPDSNPLGIAVGGLLFTAGSVLILVIRPIALRNELEATMKTMVGVVADQPEPMRHWLMQQRINTMAAMPEPQRRQHITWMAQGLKQLPAAKRNLMMETQMTILAESAPEVRRAIMITMDQVMMGGV